MKHLNRAFKKRFLSAGNVSADRHIDMEVMMQKF